MTCGEKLDCSQSPIFPWVFRDSYAVESRKSHGKIGDCEQSSETQICQVLIGSLRIITGTLSEVI